MAATKRTVSSTRYGYIDALKGWGILGTIVVHTGLWGDGRIEQLANAGARMCQLFFIISAFLLYDSYTRTCQKHGGTMTVKECILWIRKRFIRLIPLWYLSILVHLLTKGWSHYWLGSEGRVTVKNILTHIFFLHGFFPYYMDSVTGVEWYIGDIAVLILLIPVIYKFLHSFTSVTVCILLSNAVLRHGVYYLQNVSVLPPSDDHIWMNYIGNFGVWNQIPVMLTGVLLYHLVHTIDFHGIIKNKKGISLCLLVISLLLQFGLIFKDTCIWSLTVFTEWSIAFAFLFISQYIDSLVPVDNPVTRILGKYSYPIYLFHYGVAIRLYETLGIQTGSSMADAVLKIGFTTLVSLSAGIVLTKYIEAPCIKIMDRFMVQNTKNVY